MGVDLQIQIYILAGVFGLVSAIIIFFLAGICGQLSKIKRQQRDQIGNHFYDNYAYTSRTIQPDEELDRRGYIMYDPYHRNTNGTNEHHKSSLNVRNSTETGKDLKTQIITQHQQQQSSPSQSSQQQHHNNVNESIVGEGNRDLANEYSIKNSETVVMTGNDIEMKIKSSYLPEFKVEPPPAFQST